MPKNHETRPIQPVKGGGALKKHCINIRAGQAFEIGGVVVSLQEKRGSIARLIVLADPSVKVLNPEETQQARRSALTPFPQGG